MKTEHGLVERFAGEFIEFCVILVFDFRRVLQPDCLLRIHAVAIHVHWELNKRRIFFNDAFDLLCRSERFVVVVQINYDFGSALLSLDRLKFVGAGSVTRP